jgi:spore maturation protein CgeB
LSDRRFVPNGPHERLFSAALNGVVTLSDENPYIKQLFGDSIITYKFTELDQLSPNLSMLLKDDDTLIKMSETSEIIAKSHIWSERAGELLGIIEKWGI